MAIIIETELQSDLEALYKMVGDLLNEMEMKEYDSCSQSSQQFIKLLKLRLEDIAGTLQKDIFNLRHIVMKLQTGEHGA